MQERDVWPFLWIYALLTVLNILVTGLLGQHEIGQQRTLLRQLQRLLMLLLPWCLLLILLRQYLMLNYTSDVFQDISSVFKYFLGFAMILLPLAGWLAVFMLLKTNQLHYASLQKQHQLSQKARQARLKVLRYQLNPHFMFNTLNALNALIVTRNGAASEQLIQQLSIYLRHSLKNQQDEFIPLQQELEVLSAYMAIQQVRFGERLQVHWQVPEPVPALLIPPLLLQPLAENAIQYSVAEMTGKINLLFSLQLQDKLLHITLAQQGADASNGWPVATPPINLTNLAERLQLLFGDAASFSFSLSPAGFYSQLSIPMETLYDSRT
ncbi:hypothetical protein GCM10010919_04160 [Alishewanella longhuensis]|uniref:Signal transduction histidine kinase internal region domain-containing protein n=2 Tax=Alishewanella longhuensis TaxID=1091037 RepID=A0ABQ3KYJ3_9ALTE|nr:hypothetical protein GCM10010919_04160 [Alishewanella longhuensis]